MRRANPRQEIAEENVRPEITGEDAHGEYRTENFFVDGGGAGEDLEQLGRNHRSAKAGKSRELNVTAPEVEVGEQDALDEGGSKNFFENGSYGGEGDGEFEWIE